MTNNKSKFCFCSCKKWVKLIKKKNKDMKLLVSADSTYFITCTIANLITCLLEFLWLKPISKTVCLIMVIFNAYLFVVFLCASIRCCCLITNTNVDWKLTRNQYLEYLAHRNFYMISQTLKLAFEFTI